MARDYAALGRFIRSRMHVPAGWAPPAQDCCDFSFGGVAALTGVDHWAVQRPRYSTELGAAKILRRHGGVRGLADRYLKPLPSPALARRGDVGLFLAHAELDGPLEETLGLVEGDFLWGVGLAGLVPVPRVHMIEAWSAD